MSTEDDEVVTVEARRWVKAVATDMVMRMIDGEGEHKCGVSWWFCNRLKVERWRRRVVYG